MMASANYNGKGQNIYFRPLNSLSGHFIATFVDQEVTNGPLTISMVSCFVLFLSYLLLILGVFMVLYYSTFKSSKLRQTIYMFNFLRPYETEVHFRKYKRLICVSTMVIVYLLLSAVINYQHFDFLISELALISISLLIFTFYTLSRHMPDQKLMHTRLQQQSTGSFAMLALAFIVIMSVRVGYYTFGHFDFWLLINALFGLLVVLIVVLEVYSDKSIFRFSFIDKASESPGQLQAVYKLYLFLWVIILSIIPINIFLRVTFEEERAIFAKYRSLELLDNLRLWEATNQKEFADKFNADSLGHFQQFVSSMREDSIYIATIESKVLNRELEKSDFVTDNSNPLFDSFYAYIRPDYNQRSSISGKYVRNYAPDSSWFFVQHHHGFITSYFPNFGQQFAANTVVMAKTDFLKTNGAYLLLITLVSVIVLMKFLSFALCKIYGFAYKQYALKKGMDQKTFGEYFLNPKFFSNSSSYNNIFIVGVNASNTFHIKNYLKEHFAGSFLTLDFYDFDEETITLEDQDARDIFGILRLGRLSSDWKAICDHAQMPDKEMHILIEHFEFGYNDMKMNKLKLQALKYIVDNKNFKVLISSEINATKLLDYYEDYIKRMVGWLKKAGPETSIGQRHQLDELKVDYKKWQHLLGSFVKCIVPINIFDHEQELAHGEYLDMISKYLGDRKNDALPVDDKILSIQQMSYPYYFAVWNSLSKDERYIVYDIAKDKFLNTVNVNGILSLLDKGILIYDHSLRIMNESFANFVLTKVNSDEALEMEMESRAKGTWNTAFAVLFLLIISLVIFLSIGQQNFLNDLNTFLTGIAALIGLLIRFSGFLSFGGKSSNE
ncbi:MAG: hypothetical protein HC819_08005 [Cyclobacteriaceae bacterium]|nr:hypothetical protein [Cyclobacteriaceae bacterium]